MNPTYKVHSMPVRSSIRRSDTCRRGYAVSCREPRRQDGVSLRHMAGAGIGVLLTSGTLSRVHRGFFVPTACFMAGRVRGQKCPPMLVSVRQPQPDRHPIGVGRRDTTRLQASNMNTQPLKGTTPEIRPFHPESTVIQRSITTLEASSLLLERLHLQADPHLMLGIVIQQLRATLIDLEGLRHEC